MSREFTGFDNIKARNLTAKQVKGLLGGVTLSKADNYALADDEKVACVSISLSEASKALTLGIDDGDVMLVHNSGATNAVTVKNLSSDTGTSVAAGKVALVIGSTAANETDILTLN